MTSNNIWDAQPTILLYTMTNALGDYLIMGDVMRKAKRLLPKSHCLMVHRGNSNIKQWPDGPSTEIFYNVYSPAEMISLTGFLTKKRKEGYIVFGLQMSPGSLQGFALHRWLKLLGALDYIVDFNLINADLITFSKDSYILDRQLNQLRDLFCIDMPSNFYHLNLPIHPRTQKNILNKVQGKRYIGIHPWNRKGTDSFLWPLNKWVEVIKHLLQNDDNEIIIFGKDPEFESLIKLLEGIFPNNLLRMHFLPASSVENLIDIVEDLDMVLTVNSSVAHIAYALHKKMVILTGPSLDLWNPQAKDIRLVTDTQAIFKGVDKSTQDQYMPQVARIEVVQVIQALKSLS